MLYLASSRSTQFATQHQEYSIKVEWEGLINQESMINESNYDIKLE